MTPLVSVVVITYQHKNYISQCLEGILMQQTNFPYEIILGEDESTDGTRKICIEYANKYPDKIRLFLRSRKDVIYISGSPTGRFNFMENLKASRGKYIAICEGDDYWIDPFKLQKQVDFLEANPNYGLVHTNWERKTRLGNKPFLKVGDTTIISGSVFETLLVRDNFILMATICVRRDYILEWCKILGNHLTNKWSMADFPLWLEGSLHTQFAFFSDITAHYRILQESASHSIDPKKQFVFFNSVFDIKYYFIKRENLSESILKKIIIQYNKGLFYHALQLEDKQLAKNAYLYLKSHRISLSVKELCYYWGAKSDVFGFIIRLSIKFKKILF